MLVDLEPELHNMPIPEVAGSVLPLQLEHNPDKHTSPYSDHQSNTDHCKSENNTVSLIQHPAPAMGPHFPGPIFMTVNVTFWAPPSIQPKPNSPGTFLTRLFISLPSFAPPFIVRYLIRISRSFCQQIFIVEISKMFYIVVSESRFGPLAHYIVAFVDCAFYRVWGLIGVVMAS
jgi:hypothetical protein